MEPLPEEVKRFVAIARVCRIASVRADGTPHVIPVCPVFDGESTVYVDIGRRYTTAEALRANPSIAVLIDEYDDDWTKLKAVLLSCRVEEAVGEEKDRAWGMISEKYPQGELIGWSARLTLALRIRDWSEWGITAALPYEPK